MDALQRLSKTDTPKRLWARDPALFSDDPLAHEHISDSLGWVGLAQVTAAQTSVLARYADDVLSGGTTDVVLLGMGGSSLASLVVDRVLGTLAGYAHLHVVDTVSPAVVSHLLHSLDPGKTLVIVSSKSGSTIEPMSLYAIFRAWIEDALGPADAGGHFIALTDEGSPLEALGRALGFRALVNTPADIGGRYSALSVFHTLPASLLGVDLDAQMHAAVRMEQHVQREASDNPAASLAAFLESNRLAGRDKLTLVTSPGLSAFGLWVEQLVAESLGKRGLGIVPVPERGLPTADALGDDRAVVVIRTADDGATGAWGCEFAAAGGQVHEIVLLSTDELFAEFVRWEFAVAMLGSLMGVDPFDQPNVAEAKQATDAILARPTQEAGPGAHAPTAEDPPDVLRDIASALRPHDYLVVLAYLPDERQQLDPLRDALDAIRDRTHAACILQLGPRYLHSTGQLHKGGPNTGVFLIVTARDAVDVEVPGKPFTLSQLHRAQAEGDLSTLRSHDRRVAHVDLPSSGSADISWLADQLRDAFGA